MKRLTIIGGGAWGCAIAHVAASGGDDREIRIWARDETVVDSLNRSGENPRYLPGVKLHPGLTATGDFSAALTGAELVFLALPSQHTSPFAAKLADALQSAAPVVLLAKGIDRESHRLLLDVAADSLPPRDLFMLSGPSFAADVARGLPTSVTIAGTHAPTLELVCRALATSTFRPYRSDDVIGVQLGGAFKNVIAIACGIVTGKGLGASACAAVATRGFAEMRRLGQAAGARAETLMGLSGFGDLMLCATSPKSRNFSLGLALGKGGDVARLTGNSGDLCEGVLTARVALELAASLGVELPITEKICAIIHDSLTIDEAIIDLMSRPLIREEEALFKPATKGCIHE